MRNNTKLFKGFKNQNIEFIYENIDKQEVSDELHPRMEKAGLDTRRYSFPVVDVNAQIFIRPKLNVILEIYIFMAFFYYEEIGGFLSFFITFLIFAPIALLFQIDKSEKLQEHNSQILILRCCRSCYRATKT